MLHTWTHFSKRWIGASLLGALLMGASALLNVALADGETLTGINEGATYVGKDVCGTCHSLEDAHFANTTHAKAFANPKSDLEAKVCEACHGPGSKHVDDATDKKALVGFTREWGTPVAAQQAQCLQCHEGGQRINWQGSPHQVNDLSCSDCHNPMAKFSQTGLMKKPSIIETCFTCHQEKRAEFSRRSHMPLLEGKISCDDCHNPHGSTLRPLLKMNTVAETCFQCHAEKRGPFLFEHPPVRQGDQCLNCHLPHGSNQQYLLQVALPMLCQQCHDPGAPHDSIGGTTGGNNALSPNGKLNTAGGGGQFVADQLTGVGCLNCHIEIHGSNSPAGGRWHR